MGTCHLLASAMKPALFPAPLMAVRLTCFCCQTLPSLIKMRVEGWRMSADGAHSSCSAAAALAAVITWFGKRIANRCHVCYSEQPPQLFQHGISLTSSNRQRQRLGRTGLLRAGG